MTARFISDPQLCAGTSPFLPVRCDAATARASLGEEMRDFMTQSAIDLRLAVFAKPAVEKDACMGVFGATGGGTQAARPFDAHFAREI